MTPGSLEIAGHESQLILCHVMDVISSAAPQENPFPHFVVDGFFPGPIYRELIEHLPDPVLYEEFGYDGVRGKERGKSRTRFRLEDEYLGRLPVRSREILHAVRTVFANAEFKEAVFEKLTAGLCRRFGCHPSDVRGLPGFPLPELFRETTGYRIKPHPDTKTKVVTMQVCLARDESQADLGTEFYRLSFSPQALLREPFGFEVAKRMPFLPNSAYAFVVLNTLSLRSWHGRSTLAESAGVRDSLLNFWYLTPDRASKDLQRIQGEAIGSFHMKE
jgi:hypothetical protein